MGAVRSLIWILILILLGPYLCRGQSPVSGKIYDAANQQPLPGVILSDSSRTQGTTTDKKGYFQWDRQWGNTILISHLGYQQRTLQLTSSSMDLHVLMTASPFQLPQLIVSATNNSQKLLEVPGPISVISKNELDRDNQTNIAEPLNRIPGLYMHSGTLNTNRITIRGIGSRSLFSTSKIRAYLNDIPLTSGDGETTIEDIDLSLIDRVEVIKGPASSVYGAGLGGTINLKASKAPYDATGLFNEFSLGSFGLLRNVSTYQMGGDKLNLKVNFSTTHQSGYRENNDYNRQSLSLLNQWYPGSNSTLTVWANWVHVKAFIPSSIDSASFAEDPRQAAFTWAQTMGFEDYDKGLAGVNYLKALSPKWDLSISAFANLRGNYELRPFNILDETSSALGTRFKVSFQPDVPLGELLWSVGAEYFNEHYQWRTLQNQNRMAGPVLSDNDERRQYYNTFSELNWTLPAGSLITVGLNYNHTRYRYQDLFLADGEDQSGNYAFKGQLSPRVAVNQKLTDHQSLYAQISHGFSPPSLSETLTPDGVINPEIKPESGYNFEIGYRGQSTDLAWYWDVSIYHMDIRNLLVARRTGDDMFVGVNAGKTRHQGIDATLNHHMTTTNWDFLLWTAYGFADYIFKDFQDDGNDYSGNQLTGTPKHKISWGLDWDHSCGFYGNLNILSVGKMPLRDDNSIFSDGYALMNLKGGYQKEMGKRLKVKIYLAVNNLWNEKYASMLLVNASSFGGNAPRYYYPGLPRNYFGGFSANFKLH